MLYLTPLVFNQLNFSAREIGAGIALAAVVGTFSRFFCGRLLDKGLRCFWPVVWTALIALLADLLLFKANNFQEYLHGQILLGISTGLYWPAVELAVPLCSERLSSMLAFSLVRSADALGMCIGAGLGTLAAWFGLIRMIYLFDIAAMSVVLLLMSSKAFRQVNSISQNHPKPLSKSLERFQAKDWIWLSELTPIILISLTATSMFSLLQSALPLDLVQGGISRLPVSDSWSGGVIALQLFLLVLLQWPVGRWLANHDLRLGLSLSMYGFTIGSGMLAVSSAFTGGMFIVFLAQIPMSLSVAAFLPTATEAVIKTSSKNRRGLAIAIFSQCFALSAVIAPLYAGYLLDFSGNAILLWGIMALISLSMTSLVKYSK